MEEYVRRFHASGLVWDSLKKSSIFDPNKVSQSIKTIAKNDEDENNIVENKSIFQFEDNNWQIENQNKQTNLLVDKTDLKQTITIKNCTECKIIIKEKVNSILIDSCNHLDLIFNDDIFNIEFINSNNIQIKSQGHLSNLKI